MRELEELAVVPEERKPYQAKGGDNKRPPSIADGADTSTSQTTDTTTTTDAPSAKDATKPSADSETAKPVKAAELRTAYEKSKETIKTKDAEITRLQNELKAAKSTPVDDPEKKTLAEKLQAVEKRKAELEQQIQFVDYQKSEEFQTKYKKPYESAWAKAVSEVSQLTMSLEDGTTRKATAADILNLANAPLDQLDEAAERMFGKSSARVIRHVEKIRELADAQTQAVTEAEKNAETHYKEQQTQSLQQQQKMATLWQDENKAWQEKFPRWFKPEDGDEKGNELLAKGYAMADAAFSSNGNHTPEQRVKLHAELRNKAAAFPKVAYKLKEARTRIKELEKSLAEYENSEPKAGEGGKPRATTPADGLTDGFAELDSIAKKGR